MQITDIFIRRPVLATVISLLILVLGIRSMSELPIRQYPYTQNATVTVTTAYIGADPALVAGFITTPIETALSQANGVEYITSSSLQGVSTVNAVLLLNYDANKALSEINTNVNAILNQLPPGAQQPAITITVGQTIGAMYIGFSSKVLSSNKITDYLIRIVQPKLQAIDGIQEAKVIGEREFALRAWLDPGKMAAYNLTATDVSNALASNNFISAVGRTQGQMITINMTAETDLHTVDEFKNMVLKSENGAIVRLQDIAKVTLGSDNYDISVSFDNKDAVYIGILVSPSANVLNVIENVRKVFPEIQSQLPEGLEAEIAYDSTKYIKTSIHEVERSLIEALLIVTGVIFLFLGSVRSVIIPVIAIPLSLIGTLFIMLLLDYSINLLTLLSFVLAIGLVVDDAIIVVENVHRHMENGMSRLKASIQGARELANPIIAISVILIAVYLPIGFMGGLTGALFTEFAFTLAGAVGISAIVALTLSPMMCSKLLTSSHNHNGTSHRLSVYIDMQFDKWRKKYQHSLHSSLNFLPVTAVFSVIIFVSIYFLYTTSKTELAPQEDQGIVISLLQTAPNATLEQTERYTQQVYEKFLQFPELDHVFQLVGINGLNTSISGIVLKNWEARKKTTNQIQPELQNMFASVSGANIVAFQPASLPGASGLPIQFVIETTDSYERLNEVSNQLLEKARASGQFIFLDTDLKLDKQQTSIVLNRDMAAQLGLTMRDIGFVLGSNLGGNYVNYFNLAGRSYQVIPQVMGSERFNADQLLNYYITANGSSIPISTIASLKTTVVPESLNRFQQLNSATISGVALPSVSLGQAIKTLNSIAKEVLPAGYSVDYSGQSRQFQQESSSLLITFFFALIIIFLTLSALFESFRDPLIVLISVPMSICGAMIFVSLGVGGASLNIYTEVGLVTLIGLISKHGILIVQFANDLQREGKTKREAIEMAAAIRLRPILMTTASMVLGVIPLIIATGAGAESRFNIGLVIASGISIGTVFTLYVVPAMYLFLADTLEKETSYV